MSALTFHDLSITVSDLPSRADVLDDEEMALVLGGRGYYRRRRRRRRRSTLRYFAHKVRMHAYKQRRRMRSRRYRRAKRGKPSVLSAFKAAMARQRG